MLIQVSKEKFLEQEVWLVGASKAFQEGVLNV